MTVQSSTAYSPWAVDMTESVASLQRGVDFLNANHRGRTVSNRGGCTALASHAESRLRQIQGERPGRVCVLVLGEFKAGKSTLINALFERAVCATDVFEMTGTVCRITPIVSGTERVVLTIDGDTPAERIMTLTAFVTATKEQAEARRRGAPGVLDGCREARLFLYSDLALEIVDTPGLGATLQNEVIALDAVSTADLVLWTLDVECLGGAREAALVGRLRESGQPVLFALTKADLVDDGEVDELLDYVAETYGVPTADIFPVSAERALGQTEDEGVRRLRERLLAAAPNRAFYREHALHAQSDDIAAELAAGVEQILDGLRAAVSDAEQNRDSLLSMAGVVTDDVCGQIVMTLRERMRMEMESSLIGRMGRLQTRPTEQDLVEAFSQSITKVDTHEFWQQLQTQVAARFQDEWSAGIKAQIEVLSRSFDDMRQDASDEWSDLSEGLYREKVQRLERKRQAVGMAVEGGIAAVVLAVVHLPLIVIAAAAAPGVWTYLRCKMAEFEEPPVEALEYMVRSAVNSWLEGEFGHDMMRDFAPRLLQENQGIALVAADNYAGQREDWPGTLAELYGLSKRAEDCLTALNALRAKRPPLLVSSTAIPTASL